MRPTETGSTREILVLHADHESGDHSHRDETAVLVDDLPGAVSHTWYENSDAGDHHGFMGLAEAKVPEGVEVFLCGPLPFMREVRARFPGVGVPPRLVHHEIFDPDMWLGAA